MKEIIINLLTKNLKPTFLHLEDQSASHAGHNEAAKAGGTHFDLKIVSPEFTGKSRVQRHRMIYKIFDSQLKEQVHALSITALSPDEYSE